MYVEAIRLSTYALKGRGNRRLVKSWRTLILGCDKTHEVIRVHEQLSKTDQIILTSPVLSALRNSSIRQCANGRIYTHRSPFVAAVVRNGYVTGSSLRETYTY